MQTDTPTITLINQCHIQCKKATTAKNKNNSPIIGNVKPHFIKACQVPQAYYK